MKEHKSDFEKLHDALHEFKMALLHDHPFGKFLKWVVKITGRQLKEKYRK